MKKAARPAILAAVILLAVAVIAEAQQATKIPRIGYLSGVGNSARDEAFRQGLRELGYVEGKNIVIEYRYAEGKLDGLSAIAAKLVLLKVDVIVATGPLPTRYAKQATASIPIVMAYDDDPVGSGFVASLARPGGNITGLSTLSPELSGKQLELLKGGRSQAVALGRHRECDATGQPPNTKRDQPCRRCIRGTASISGD